MVHPDKNDAPDAEAKFRQLVGIYEVLKDEERRIKYDQVLINGLPDWRQPLFYYRRVRKMGTLELVTWWVFFTSIFYMGLIIGYGFHRSSINGLFIPG